MTHPNIIADPADAREFICGGRAVFTLRSGKTGKRYTYKVTAAKDAAAGPAAYFAKVLTGPDNGADYTYIGFMAADASRLIAGRKGSREHPAFTALDWTVKHLASGSMPAQLELWHEGQCARCARPLTDPVSIERGFGPECVKRLAEVAA